MKYYQPTLDIRNVGMFKYFLGCFGIECSSIYDELTHDYCLHCKNSKECAFVNDPEWIRYHEKHDRCQCGINIIPDYVYFIWRFIKDGLLSKEYTPMCCSCNNMFLKEQGV